MEPWHFSAIGPQTKLSLTLGAGRIRMFDQGRGRRSGSPRRELRSGGEPRCMDGKQEKHVGKTLSGKLLLRRSYIMYRMSANKIPMMTVPTSSYLCVCPAFIYRCAEPVAGCSGEAARRILQGCEDMIPFTLLRSCLFNLFDRHPRWTRTPLRSSPCSVRLVSASMLSTGADAASAGAVEALIRVIRMRTT